VNTIFRSTTDPDCRVVRHDGGKARPCFKNHRVIDDRAGVTTAIATTHGTANEGNELMALLDQHEQRTGLKPDTAVADCCHGDTENLVALAQAGIRAHVGDLRSRLVNARSRGIFPAEQFTYHVECDTFTCPAGQQLCRHQNQEELDRARADSHSEAARADRKRRQWFQERHFGEAAVMHGAKRARWRRIWRQRIQDLIIAAIQNLKILIRRHVQAAMGLFARLLRWWRHSLVSIKEVFRRVAPGEKHLAITAPVRFGLPGQQPVNA